MQRASARVEDAANRRIRVVTVGDGGLSRDLGYEDVQLRIIEGRRLHNTVLSVVASRGTPGGR